MLKLREVVRWVFRCRFRGVGGWDWVVGALGRSGLRGIQVCGMCIFRGLLGLGCCGW